MLGFFTFVSFIVAVTSGGVFWPVFVVMLIVWVKKQGSATNAPPPREPPPRKSPQSQIPSKTTPEHLGKDDSNDWVNQLTEICSQYSGSDYYVAELIPQKKLENARETYLVPGYGRVIALIDATVFGSANNGMAICTKGISWHNLMETKPTSMSWRDFSMVDIKRDGEHDVAIGAGNKFNMSACGGFDKDKAVQLLKAIQSGFTEVEKFQSKSKPNPSEKVVDIASASYEELLVLPGIGAAEANILLKHRESGEKLGSIDGMADLLNLKPHIAERLKDRVKFSESKPPPHIPPTPATSKSASPSMPNTPGRGRTID